MSVSFPAVSGRTASQGSVSNIDPETDGRFLSRAQCGALLDRIVAMTTGGGVTQLSIESVWTDSLRWVRNVIATGGETQQSDLEIFRIIRRCNGRATTNALTDDLLRATVERAEHLLLFGQESPDTYPDPRPEIHPHARPTLWFNGTVSPDDGPRAELADKMIDPAATGGLSSAGYFQVAASCRSVITNDGLFRYYPYTTVQCSVTVRDPKGRGSGWAGVDWNDVARLDAARVAQTALDKCLRSRNPVAVEPGRFTAILEPQAVGDLVGVLVDIALDRVNAELGTGPFADPTRPGYSRIGQRVADPRITLSADPMDPDCGFVPFDWGGEPYVPVKWIDNGVLRELRYDRMYGLHQLDKDAALPNSGAFRLSGGTSSIDDMVAATARGVLVTRFNNVRLLDFNSMLMNGNTRDGFWLIERGKITKPIKNFRFTESPMFVLNNIEMLGVPQRVFRPEAPAVVPPIMVRDFSFTGLVDAV